ncbi:MAG: DPP IV N-terminal domain-containing protein [Bacteroidales bacterium]|jgi:dipeptidyl-peptidase-4|nr:DPP IV N-terminal domain-containing protein [Bacteroidales bacterium]
MKKKVILCASRCAAGLLTAFLLLPAGLLAQDRLPSMPGYENYRKMQGLRQGLSVTDWRLGSWSDDGKSFTYTQGGKTFRYTIAGRKTAEIEPAVQPGRGQMPARQAGTGERVARGRQATTAMSPDGKLRAFYRDNNLWLSNADGSGEYAVTTAGNAKDRIKYGSASWTYGEELSQTTAMWWSPDGRKLSFYRFDETGIEDYYVINNHLSIQNGVDIEPYVKAGAKNPLVDVYVYDIEKKTTVKVDVRSGEPFSNNVMGHYVYAISWTDDGRELLLHRTNRRQNTLELCAANPETGTLRVIFREEWLPSFVSNRPMRRYLSDNNRFILQSERNGFSNYYLYDMSGRLHATLTNHPFEVAGIVKVDEAGKKLYYMARSSENHMMLQLHVVGLDGKGDMRLTDPAFNHSVNISPDNKYFIDTYQTHNIPPATRLVDMKGRVVAELSKGDLTKFTEIGLRPVEQFTFKSADGVTDLFGTLHFPANFDPSKKYPVLFSVYGGPGSTGASESFTTPNAMTEYGFLVVQISARNAAGRGKAISDAYYENLGIVEIDDFAAGIKSLWNRPYFNRERVGVYGTSYGGYTAAMCILRYPEVFHAAVANSAVTDWRNYDSVYTERYMWIPQENQEGYDNGSAMKYAANLKGNLMIYYGSRDDNVHPSNSYQLITALQRAGKHFEVQVGPDQGHTAVNSNRMMEFFIYHLIMN